MFSLNFNPQAYNQQWCYPIQFPIIFISTPQIQTCLGNEQYINTPFVQNSQSQTEKMSPMQIIPKLNLETEGKQDSESHDTSSNEANIHREVGQNKIKKNSQKPNFLLKSTNIQKNYAKAIVSYALRQRVLIFKIIGEQKGQEFLKLMNRLRNKLRNISHITRYTHNPDYLSLFRILGNNFLRNESVSYIYNSKIQQKSCHLSNKQIVKHSLLKY